MVLIIGGGIMGLSIGWKLAKKGISVRILEAGKKGQASRAAAGMLAPYAEEENSHLKIFSEESFSLYPSFLEELFFDSGIRVPFENRGSLYVGTTHDDLVLLRRHYDVKKASHMPIEWLTRKEIHDLEPLLSPRVTSGFFLSKEGQVDNRILLQALRKAFSLHEGVFIEGEAIKILTEKNTVQGALLQEGSVLSTTVINAAGAWAKQIDPFPVDLKPNKGQILTLQMDKSLPLSGVVRSPRIYLAPKESGLLRIGATNENLGFDEKVTAGAMWELLEHAIEIYPAAYECQIVEMETGFRPEMRDNRPLIGKTSLIGYFQAFGHGRMGILLAPFTAKYLTEEILCRFK